jgi:hypothetical protein
MPNNDHCDQWHQKDELGSTRGQKLIGLTSSFQVTSPISAELCAGLPCYYRAQQTSGFPLTRLVPARDPYASGALWLAFLSVDTSIIWSRRSTLDTFPGILLR